MTKLYEISDNYHDAMKMVEDGEITAEMMADTLDAIEGERDEKLTACGAQVLNLLANANTIGNEIKRLQARKKAFENNAKWLKQYMLTHMQRMGCSRIETPLYSIKVNAGKSKSVEITDLAKLDDQFITEITTVKVDKKAIGDLLKAGETVAGAELAVKDTLTIG